MDLDGKMKRVEVDVKVLNTLGLHARPAALLVRKANTFQSDITLSGPSGSGSCKSVLDLLMLAAGRGTTLKLAAEGGDAEAASQAIAAMFQSKFGEE